MKRLFFNANSTLETPATRESSSAREAAVDKDVKLLRQLLCDRDKQIDELNAKIKEFERERNALSASVLECARLKEETEELIIRRWRLESERIRRFTDKWKRHVLLRTGGVDGRLYEDELSGYLDGVIKEVEAIIRECACRGDSKSEHSQATEERVMRDMQPVGQIGNTD